jgi:hypothetical protein
MATNPHRTELERIRRVSDQSCSVHSWLGQRHERRALALELAILGASIWLVAVAFVKEPVSGQLTPFDWDPQIWVGCLGCAVFFLTLLVAFVGWKVKGEAHKRSAGLYAEVKAETGRELLNTAISTERFKRVEGRYNFVGQLATPIPEREFLRQKKRHALKVAISKHIDNHPGSSILLTRLRFWWRDNVTG